MVFLDRHNTLALRLYTEFDLNIKDMDTRNERKSFLQMQAYDSIKNGILNGELEPGQLYSETKLSAK